MLSFFPLDVLDEIWDLIESVSESFPTYFSYGKIRDLCQYYKLVQIVTEPTNFTETSSSTTDLFFTSNKNNLILSGVPEPFLSQNIRYQSPIYCVLNFDEIKTRVHIHKRVICTTGLITMNFLMTYEKPIGTV